MGKLPEIQIVIPYKDLVELLEASKEIKDLRSDNKRLHDQLGALRSQFTELMDQFRDLKDFVTD